MSTLDTMGDDVKIVYDLKSGIIEKYLFTLLSVHVFFLL